MCQKCHKNAILTQTNDPIWPCFGGKTRRWLPGMGNGAFYFFFGGGGCAHSWVKQESFKSKTLGGSGMVFTDAGRPIDKLVKVYRFQVLFF